MSEMIYGIHAVQALLERAPERFQEVFILKGREDKRLLPLIHALESQGVVIQLANRQYLDEKSDGAVHQGIIARVKPGRQYQENDLPDLIALHERPFLLILDGVTDPHNLGACLRSADAAGVHAVIVPKDRSAQLNATAKKVACGAAESVPLIRVTNLARTMRMLQEENIWIVGTAGEADHTLYQSKMPGRMALVMGAEGEGMRRLTREHCDELISIPMAGSVSSLNVSVATGICLFEAVRTAEPVQRHAACHIAAMRSSFRFDDPASQSPAYDGVNGDNRPCPLFLSLTFPAPAQSLFPLTRRTTRR